MGHTANGDFDADINQRKCREEVDFPQPENLFVLVRCDGLWLRTDVATFLLDYYVPRSRCMPGDRHHNDVRTFLPLAAEDRP